MTTSSSPVAATPSLVDGTSGIAVPVFAQAMSAELDKHVSRTHKLLGLLKSLPQSLGVRDLEDRYPYPVLKLGAMPLQEALALLPALPLTVPDAVGCPRPVDPSKPEDVRFSERLLPVFYRPTGYRTCWLTEVATSAGPQVVEVSLADVAYPMPENFQWKVTEPGMWLAVRKLRTLDFSETASPSAKYWADWLSFMYGEQYTAKQRRIANTVADLVARGREVSEDDLPNCESTNIWPEGSRLACLDRVEPVCSVMSRAQLTRLVKFAQRLHQGAPLAQLDAAYHHDVLVKAEAAMHALFEAQGPEVIVGASTEMLTYWAQARTSQPVQVHFAETKRVQVARSTTATLHVTLQLSSGSFIREMTVTAPADYKPQALHWLVPDFVDYA